MSDSDDDYNFGFSGNHMAGNQNNAGIRDLSNPSYNNERIKDLDYGENDFGQKNENDLNIEDDWDYEQQDGYNNAAYNEPKSSYQEMKDRQKDKLKNKTYTNTNNSNNINYGYKKHQPEGPGLDDIYERELKPKIDQYDRQLEGEIQHEGLKENLDEYRNHRVEYVAEDPSKLLNKQSNQEQDYGRVNQVDMDGAQISSGMYNDGEKPKKKRKKKKKKIVETDEQLYNDEEIESTQLANTDSETMSRPQPQYEELDIDGNPIGPTAEDAENGYPERKTKKSKSKKKSSKKPADYEEEDKVDSNEMVQEPPEHYDDREEEEGYGVAPGTDQHPEGEGEEEREHKSKKKKKDSKSKKEKKNKRKEEILKIKNAFMEKLISPFTEVDELIQMFMKPLPKEVGILECTIMRNKSGFNYWNPKYTLVMSDGERFLLNGKKRGGNKTSNYLITLDQDKLKKKGQGYLGKLRANFMGTEFVIYDQGENPKKAKNVDLIRREMASVLYESNVLGSKGPRKMRVLIPAIDKDDNI